MDNYTIIEIKDKDGDDIICETEDGDQIFLHYIDFEFSGFSYEFKEDTMRNIKIGDKYKVKECLVTRYQIIERL